MQIQKKSLPLHPQLRNKPSVAIFKIASKEVKNGENKVFSIKLQKSSSKIWKFKKLALPLHHFRTDKQSRGKNKGSKNFLKKVCKKFGSLKNLPYLCIRFRRIKNAKVFENGSLNYWLYIKRENVVFICQFPLMENEVVRTLTIHYNFFLQWRV